MIRRNTERVGMVTPNPFKNGFTTADLFYKANKERGHGRDTWSPDRIGLSAPQLNVLGQKARLEKVTDSIFRSPCGTYGYLVKNDVPPKGYKGERARYWRGSIERVDL